MPRPSKKAAKPPSEPDSGSQDDHHDDDDDVQEPPTIDPYEVLGLERDATADQIKTAYRKAALRNHPDKVAPQHKETATSKFQAIAVAYAILSSPHRRQLYDTTGSTSEPLSQDHDDGFNWAEYYATCFADSISPETIAAFAQTYKSSDEERADVLAAYTDFEGDMDGVYESVMLSDVLEDDERFRGWIDEAIERGEVEAYDAYKKETKKRRTARVKAARGEAKEAEELAKELGVHDKLKGKNGGKGGMKGKKDDGGGENALAALILARQQSRGDMFDRLAEKYGAKPKGKGGKKRKAEEEPPEIDEEEFQRIQAGLGKGGSSGAKKGKKRKA
ncbi:hypothetical protein QBC32DRAFT_220186 [Pseudoneurospora amorphoporcata]|uniref:J domain-containing protein n=1 Tax=Pseudoneurospora amorphoporcata TaxID=241081 RepID=A0AAN6SCH7_9PEZI|nr:hypothetical protein QBC32DRAFT_220186 [Pseudoneurospora amorphoporcata]